MFLSAPKQIFLLLLLTFLIVQVGVAQDNYEREWSRVENLTRKNKPGAAFEEARGIYERAKQDGNDLQAVRAIVYMSGLYTDNTNKNRLFFIQQLEKELIRAKGITKPLLQSILAESYWNYWKSIRYSYYSRADTIPYREYDMDTWNAADYHRKISSLYWASIREEQLLQHANPDAILPLLAAGNARILRPTLYDLLAFRAFDYFKDDERDITKPAYSLDLDLATSFAPPGVFIERLTNENDSTQHPALIILRKLIAFHLHDNDAAALIDADIQRIELVYRRSIHPDKAELYMEALNRIRREYGDHPAAAQASYLRASYYADQGKKWKPFGTEKYRFEKVKAKQIIDSISKQARPSEGKNNCTNLLISMQVPELNFEMEQVNIPDKPFRVRVRYRNTPVIHLRIIPFSNNLLERERPDELSAAICTVKPLREWQQTLPAAEDMQAHSAEIKVDGLTQGKYILLAADQDDFKNKKTTVVAQVFYVSSIGIIHEGKDFFLLDRETGQPLADATVQVWEKYNVNNTLIREKGNHYKSDSNGFFHIQLKSERAAKLNFNVPVQLDVHYKEEQLFMNDNGMPPAPYRYRYRPYDTGFPLTDTNMFLFTDRSIYRPGQTVYFKGIALAKDSTGRSGSVAVHTTYLISLQNANRETVSSEVYETNEYGAVSGSFRIPVSGLNGTYHLRYDSRKEGAAFRVEEYKRPTFITRLDPVRGQYKVNDSITITGNVKAYAGNSMEGAKVSYRVYRRARFIYDWYWQGNELPYVREQEMVNGLTITDNAGKFYFSFKAKPDTSIETASNPVYDYSLVADVTDINGETRSAESLLSVSYQPFLIETALPARVSIEKLDAQKIQTKNLNGEFVPAPLTIRFTRVQDEKRLIRQRYWERSDHFTMNKDEYLRFFPNDEYDNESSPGNRPLGNTELTIRTTSAPDGVWAADNQIRTLSPGHYQFAVSAPGAEGTMVEEKKYVELYSISNEQSNYPVYWQHAEGGTIEVGDTMHISIGSSAENCFIIQQTSRGGGQLPPPRVSYQFHRLSNGKINLAFTATKADQGGYGVNWVFVKHNRIFSASTTLQIPWTDKNLLIDYASFRDKTTPGSEEQWKLTIRGSHNEKVVAEMLAGMYDASLDQLYAHIWSKPILWANYLQTRYWNSEGFNKNYGQAINEPKQVYERFVKAYDVLIADYVFSRDFFIRQRTEPLWWINPLTYIYDEERNPRLMRLPKPILPDSDGDGVTDQKDMEQTTEGCPVDSRGVALDTDGDGIPDCKDKDNDKKEDEPVKARTNFNETAFFLPHLQTDSSGAISFTFTLPESLTQWKFQGLAHTKDLKFGYTQRTIVTQKPLMVQTNVPRFVREKDKVAIVAKLSNLNNEPLSGEVRIELTDEETGKPLDSLFRVYTNRKSVQVPAGLSIAVPYILEVPAGYTKPLVWRITARTKNNAGEIFSDGEQNTLPVLSGRMFITESMPLYNQYSGTQHFQFSKLLASGNSLTLSHFALTTEYNSNPAWIALQSLPYLMEFPHECAEQTWNRFYANALASILVQSSPAISNLFDQWMKADSNGIVSALQKNESLHLLQLEETPWVSEAKNETAQKRKMLALFNKGRTTKELESVLVKLQQLQNSSGGFSWFNGGYTNSYITQYIVSGIGHLKKLVTAISPEAWTGRFARKLEKLMANGMAYIDNGLKEDYDKLMKGRNKDTSFRPSPAEIQRLYARSFFTDNKPIPSVQKAIRLYTEQATLHWTTYNHLLQGMITLINYRNGDREKAGQLLSSLKSRAIKDSTGGIFWADTLNRYHYYWHQSPVETQSLLIEAFLEAGQDTTTVYPMQTWLLHNKQSNSWGNTKATAEACYALLLAGKNILYSSPDVTVTLGQTTLRSADEKVEPGTAFFRKKTEGSAVHPQMGNVTLSVSNKENKTFLPGWGAIHWQYFEDVDKISAASTQALQLTKKIFKEKNGPNGPELVPVTPGTLVKTGDKIVVQLVLRTSQDMEFIQIKDQRAASFEPVKSISGYYSANGIGYYESTKDASTHFFIDYLPRGNYMFEYRMFATHAGNFSNGFASAQCMYAPEFNAHSESIRISVQ